MTGNRMAIDVGGTFIDFVLLDETSGAVKTEKELSLIRELSDHIFDGVDRLGVGVSELDMIIHGSTVVINTILQERGDVVGLITTEGFRDALELGRGSRPEVYNLLYKPPKPLVPRYLRTEVPERLNHKGAVVTPLDEYATRAAIERLKHRDVAGIAVCFLHAYANPSHERRVREIIRDVYPEVEVSISSDITGEFREFERTSTVVLNTYVMPRMRAYIGDLDRRLTESGFEGALNMIQSTGGMVSYREAQSLPIRTLESGPAGGVIGALALGDQIGQPNLIASDVGGTSFDVALIQDGQPFEKSETFVNERPVLQPTIDIVSIGAGGGSIAWLDEAGAFRVGPSSAEADPGPACFGKGGMEPTVTDAHLLLGRINPDFFLGQRMKLDVTAAERAIREKIAEPLGLSISKAAHGITHLADTNMVNAIRQVTIERGHDPRDFSLLCYGGGGGLFAGSLATELEIRTAIIPPNPAVFSAWGILNSDYREDVVRTYVVPLLELSADKLFEMFEELAAIGAEELERGGLTSEDAQYDRVVDMRYEGQEHTVRVPVPPDAELKSKGLKALQEQFDLLHEQTYAHASPGTPTELVNLRLAASIESKKPRMVKIGGGSGDGSSALKATRKVYFKDAGGEVDCPIYDRGKLGSGDEFEGPAVIEEWNSTAVVKPGQKLQVDDYGDLIISQEGFEHATNSN
ncbi:MAG: hydantoinase/oxoprolinase family protein [Anaerolineales bacterium]